jgi:hypothetical protein
MSFDNRIDNHINIATLRPTASDSASIRDAIAKAEAARTTALDHAGHLDRAMKAALLTASNEELEQAERDANNARRDADRIGALIEELRARLADAEDREAGDHEQDRRAAAIAADEVFVAAWRKHFVKLAEAAAAILQAKRQADEAIAAIDRNGLALPRDAAFPYVYGAPENQPLAMVLRVAELAPSEVARQQSAADLAATQFMARRDRDAAERGAAIAAAALRERDERLADERKARERTIPNDFVRRGVAITGGMGW